MAEQTGIAWARSTLNWWIGCTKVSPGCDNCYAADQDARKRWDGGKTHWGAGVPRYLTSESNRNQPLRWERLAAEERRAGVVTPKSTWKGQPGHWPVFCSSLADVFDNEVPQAWRDQIWPLIGKTPNLTWLFVTKRISNVARMVPPRWTEFGFPENVRLLITVVNQEEVYRDVPKLLALPCKNGVSYEPALDAVNWKPWLQSCGPGIVSTDPHGRDKGLEWIIVGGESGPKARPFSVDWARATVRQCRAAGVPVFVKQMGSFVIDRNDAGFDGCEPESWPLRPDGCDPELDFHPFGHEDHAQGAPCRIKLMDRAGANPAEWPEDIRIQEFPK